MQVTMESELDQLYLGQKQEYRDFIIKVYEELQKRSQEEAISLSLMHLQQSVDDDTISISASSTASGRFGRSDSVSGWNIAQDLGLMGGVGGKDYNDELQSSSRSILAMAVGKLDRSPSAEMLSTVEEVEFVEVCM